jgi:hypothetical protein
MYKIESPWKYFLFIPAWIFGLFLGVTFAQFAHWLFDLIRKLLNMKPLHEIEKDIYNETLEREHVSDRNFRNKDYDEKLFEIRNLQKTQRVYLEEIYSFTKMALYMILFAVFIFSDIFWENYWPSISEWIVSAYTWLKSIVSTIAYWLTTLFKQLSYLLIKL